MLRKRSTLLTIVSVMVLGLLVTGVVGLAGGNGPADGSCDDQLERDHDGDGVLNCNDEDWTPPEDGSGYGAAGEKGQGEGGYGFGDGTCDGNGPHGNRGQGKGEGRA